MAFDCLMVSAFLSANREAVIENVIPSIKASNPRRAPTAVPTGVWGSFMPLRIINCAARAPASAQTTQKAITSPNKSQGFRLVIKCPKSISSGFKYRQQVLFWKYYSSIRLSQCWLNFIQAYATFQTKNATVFPGYIFYFILLFSQLLTFCRASLKLRS